MKLNNQVPLQRLVGKIDNDFNISESDWIPRVAAWTIDALSQMKVLPMERKRRRLEVSDRIATFPCELNASEIKVFDKNGCEIEHLDKSKSSCNCSVSGAQQVQEIDKEGNPLLNEDGTPKMDKEGKYQQKKRVLTFVIPVQEPTEEVESDNISEVDVNTLKSEEEIFPDSLDNVENM